MICNFCKEELPNDSVFCTKCGNKIMQLQNTEVQYAKPCQPPTNIPCFPQESVYEYIDRKIRMQTTFLSAIDYLKGANPLRFRLIITLIGGFITVPYLCFGAIIGFFIGTIFYQINAVQLNSKKYDLPENIEINDLANYLMNTLSCFNFTEWQVGNPHFLFITDSTTRAIQCVFENKTIHRITFPDGENIYKIVTEGGTAKQRLIRGSSLMCAGISYKNAYRTKPILEAAIEYYFNLIKEVPHFNA